MNENQPAKKIAADLNGDTAILLDILEARLQIKGMPRKNRDTIISNLGLIAIEIALDQCAAETGCKFPDATRLEAWLIGKSSAHSGLLP